MKPKVEALAIFLRFSFIIKANEKEGWQTVEHFHIHVLPRHPEDGVALTWPAKHPLKNELDQLAEKVRQGFASQLA